jgi:hypothetical protein
VKHRKDDGDVGLVTEGSAISCDFGGRRR